MDKIKTIVGINLIILVLYTVFINVTSTGTSERDLEIMVFTMLFVGAHVAVNVLVALVMFFKKDVDAKYFLLSALVVGVVGFSACWGSVMI
jgi:hypothetical protein